MVVQYLRDACAFANALAHGMGLVAQLLGSKNNTDAVEAVHTLVVGWQFGAEGVQAGVRKMLVLIWSKEAAIKQAVLDAYKQLFFSPDPAVYPNAKVGSKPAAEAVQGLCPCVRLHIACRHARALWSPA